ncbi:MAG TPA: Zn-dependent exopeptidase M28 [Thermoplasmatales archaeon]|nr:Zn-dependent exopeptidase M28 [Thermoplasmatales archaeon]
MHLKILVSIIVFLLLTSSTLTAENKIDENHAPILEKILKATQLIDEDLLQSFLKPLVDFAPRYTGSYGCIKAAEYIYTQFKKFGLNTRYHNWSAFGDRYHPRLYRSQNIEATLEGVDDKIIVFNAHYDTVKTTPGANDDGSGTTAVLAAAYALSKLRFNHTLRFITFSGEEEGLLGSHEYAREVYSRGDNIIIEINADMIGRATTEESGNQIHLSISEDAEWVEEIFKEVNNLLHLGFNIHNYSIDREGRGWSDYFSFVEYGYESIACWDAEHDPNMHTPRDNLSNVNFSYLTRYTKLIVGVLVILADIEPPPLVRIVSPQIGYLYFDGMKIKPVKSTIVINDIWIWSETISDAEKVEFYYDGKLQMVDTTKPFKWHCNKHSIGKHRIKVIAYGEGGFTSTDYIDLRIINLLLKK